MTRGTETLELPIIDAAVSICRYMNATSGGGVASRAPSLRWVSSSHLHLDAPSLQSDSKDIPTPARKSGGTLLLLNFMKMKLPDWIERLTAHFLTLVLSFTFPGAHGQFDVSRVGPAQVTALVGSNATLSVSVTGATDPAVTWFMGDLPVLTWTVGSDAPPDIPDDNRKVLKIEPNGSLTFINVPLNYTGSYTVEMTKSGLGAASTRFSLKVYEKIQGVILIAEPKLAVEGSEQFTLLYSLAQGQVEQQRWFFNSTQIEADSHYTIEERSLTVLNPNQWDTGQYRVLLTNPFSSVTAYKNVTVLYGPEASTLEATPAKKYYEAGDSLILSCRAAGVPQPTVQWVFGGKTFNEGVLNLTNVQTSQGGVYTCMLHNELTGAQDQRNMTLFIYERPTGNPNCSVQWEGNVDLQYHCEWPGGTPPAQLSFPALSNTSSGEEDFSLTVAASDELNGETITCMAIHPLESKTCNITAKSPMKFLETVRTTVNSEGKIVVGFSCVSEASPKAVVSWFRGSEAVGNGTVSQISNDTTQLKISDHNVTVFLLEKYTCTCRNPLGSRSREIQLQGPLISDSSLFPNHDGTIITLTWEVPPTSIVTGFDIQMKGPDLLSGTPNGTRSKGSSNGYRTIQMKPGAARSTDIFVLDPESTYRFRIIPRARMTEGEPSEVHRIGPGEGLSGPAIAGIAAGIPCSLLVLLLLCGLIFFCIYCNKNKSQQARYPVSRAVEKTITIQPETTPHNRLEGGVKSPPDYNRLHQAPSERSVALPTFVPPPPVRVATTV
ncbi:V-set and immunoglobulin domain-containing protein 10-like [Aulostomus maculatus]